MEPPSTLPLSGRITLTILGTTWLASLIVAFFWSGLAFAPTFDRFPASAWWIATGFAGLGLGAAPFALFEATGKASPEQDEG